VIDDVVRPGSLWTRIDSVPSTGSTNADLRAAALAGEAEGRVLSADEQTAGRGRLGRAWTAPSGSGLAVSVLLRPEARPASEWGWLPLLVGLSAAAAVDAVAGLATTLKWPNDLMARDRKLGGILVERVETPSGPAAVVGFGLNVSLEQSDLPVPTATSLLLEGAPAERSPLLASYLRELEVRYRDWCTGETPRGEYRARCSTLGRQVRVHLPGDAPDVVGEAVDVDASGRLVVRVASPDGVGELVALSSGEVQHVR